MFLTIIDDQSSQSGGHGASFTDIITVNSDVYKGLAPDNTYHNDYANGPIHIYDGNSHESPWFRTARLKIFGISSSQFRMDLYVSSSGGYALSTTDINGVQFYPNTLARSITGITYKMYYKNIIKMRFGLDGYSRMSIDEIYSQYKKAGRSNISKAKIRIIEHEALKLLRTEEYSRELKDL